VSSLRNQINEIKQRARENALAEPDSREAIRSLIERGAWSDVKRGVEYDLQDLGDHAIARFVQGGVLGEYKGPGVFPGLLWLAKRIDAELVISTDRIRSRGSMVNIAECPFCAEQADQTCEITSRVLTGDRAIRWTWRACEHFLTDGATIDAAGKTYGVAYFTAYDVRSCDHCEGYCDDAADKCVHCGRDPRGLSPACDDMGADE